MKPGISASVFAGSPLEWRAASPQRLFSSSLDMREESDGGGGQGNPKGEGLPGMFREGLSPQRRRLTDSTPARYPSQPSPAFLAPRIGFMEDNFSRDCGLVSG